MKLFIKLALRIILCIFTTCDVLSKAMFVLSLDRLLDYYATALPVAIFVNYLGETTQLLLKEISRYRSLFKFIQILKYKKFNRNNCLNLTNHKALEIVHIACLNNIIPHRTYAVLDTQYTKYEFNKLLRLPFFD